MLSYDTRYAGDSADVIEKLGKKIKIINEIPKAVEIEKGIILPRKAKMRDDVDSPYQGRGGVLDEKQRFIEESKIYDLKNSPYQEQLLAFGGEYNFDSRRLKRCAATAVYMGFAHQHWGHFLIDIVQRAWYPLKHDLSDMDYVLAFSGFGDESTEFKENY